VNDNDSKLIWESLQHKPNPVSEADREDPRYAQLIQYFMQSDGASRQEAMQMAKDTIRKMDAKGLKVVHTEPKMRREQDTSPGRVSGGNIPFPDGRGEHQDAMWSSEGIEEMEPMEMLELIRDDLPSYLQSGKDTTEVVDSLKTIATHLMSGGSHEEGTGSGHEYDPATIKQREIDRKKLHQDNPDLSYDRAKAKQKMGLKLTDHDIQALTPPKYRK